MSEKFYVFEGKKVVLRKSSYVSNGTLAVAMIVVDDNGDESIYDFVTVNIADSDFIISIYDAFVNTNHFGNEFVLWLKENGIIKEVCGYGKSGYCIYPLVTFNYKVLDEMMPLSNN